MPFLKENIIIWLLDDLRSKLERSEKNKTNEN